MEERQAIRRGSTPTVTAHVRGVDLSDANEWPVVRLAMVSSGGEDAEPTVVGREGLTIESEEEGSAVTVTLTQAQTLALRAGTVLSFQLHFRDSSGDADGSSARSLLVLEQYDDQEI